MAEHLTAAEAAHRLGVKPATLYAYVSRGVLTRRKGPAGRTSRYDAAEIESLARRGRPRHKAYAADIVVESALTEIDGAQFRYRGLDVSALATTRSLEEVAEFLWTGQFPAVRTPGRNCRETPAADPDPRRNRPEAAAPAPEPRPAGPAAWRARPEALAAGRAAQAALPAGALPLERLQVIVPAMAATDPLRLQLDPPAVQAAARALIAGLVDCLPTPEGPTPPGPAPGTPAPIANRLWSRLTSRRPTPGLLAALNAALVLLADHELAASTLAARVAASVRADPYAVVATGLGAVSGALHGGASLGAENLLTAAATPAGVPAVIRDLLRRGEKVPGFGHFVYRAGDPRATQLLALIAAAAPRSRTLAVAGSVQAEVTGRGLPGPNIDFALAVLARVAGMTAGAGEAIFAVARTAGWSAHAMEEYVRATPLRPRAVYVGPPPRDAAGPG